MNEHQGRIYRMNGLSGNQLKLTGAVLMVMDHLHQMFYPQGMPVWFHWAGRPVAVIFLFLCAEGFHHTRSRKRYALRLLAGYWAMGLISRILSALMPVEGVALINNIFGTLFMSVIFMFFADWFRESVKARNIPGVILSLVCAALPFGAVIFVMLAPLPQWLKIALIEFVPNLVAVEGGPVAVLIAVLFYLFRGKRMAQIAVIAAVSFLAFLYIEGMEWLMIFAVVPVYLYNSKRGGGSRYFFYVFYPAHIYLFYITAWFLSGNV